MDYGLFKTHPTFITALLSAPKSIQLKILLFWGHLTVKLRVRVRVNIKRQKSKLDPEVGVVMG